MADISTLVDQLKCCSSTTKLYKILINLREIVLKEHNSVLYLKDHGAIKHLIKLLSRPNGKLLNVSLSIVGNCCLDNDFRRKAVKEGLISSLCLVMKSIAEDNIQCRCCRVIGNIALSSSTCDLLNENNVSCLLLSALSNAPSLSTQLTAIRAARLLFIGSRKDHRLNIVNSGIFKVSVNFLKSENTQVQKCVLRLILAATHSRSAGLVYKIYDDTGLGALIPLIGSQPLVLHILHSLGHVSFAQQQLAKDGLIEALIQHLQSNYCVYDSLRPNSDDSRLLSHTEYNISATLVSLTMFCHEPFCRSRLRRHPTAFDLLLNIISGSAIFAQKKSAIKTLSLFIHDEYALKTLVEKNFVSIMIKHLQQLVAESKHMRVVMVADRRTSELQDESNIRAESPTAVENTPGSSYSPVCSEGDRTPVIDDDNDELDPGLSSSPSSPNSSCTEGFCQNIDFYDTHGNFDEQIFVLEILRPITYLTKPVFELCHKTCWETLLDCLSSINKICSGVFQILFVLEAIARTRHFFSQLLIDCFPLVVHRKLCRKPKNQKQPSQLSNTADDFDKYGKTLLGEYANIAECTFGRGVIMNEFRRKLNNNKTLVSLIIAHVVRDIRFFGDVLFRCEFMENMLQALENEKLFEDAVSGLHCLALTFMISDNREEYVSCGKMSPFCGMMKSPLHYISDDRQNEVKFMLDDETSITGSKKLLHNSSPVFKAMFSGSFKESNEDVVRLPDISKDSMMLLMRLLVSKEYCTDCLLRQCSIDVLLETIVQCDRFLANETADRIMTVVMNVILSHTNSDIIYKWAIQHKLLPNTIDIPDQVIKYVLVNSTMSLDQRATAFKSFMNNRDLNTIFLRHIKDVFLNQLSLLRQNDFQSAPQSK